MVVVAALQSHPPSWPQFPNLCPCRQAPAKIFAQVRVDPVGWCRLNPGQWTKSPRGPPGSETSCPWGCKAARGIAQDWTANFTKTAHGHSSLNFPVSMVLLALCFW